MTPTHLSPGYRRALILAAVLNLLMFFVEGGAGLWIGSAALLADAVDFIEDAFTFGLAVVALGWPPKARGWAGLLQGVAMATVGIVAVREVILRYYGGGAPLSGVVACTAVLALTVNVICAAQLVRFRVGDASMRAIWLSTRNDALLNLLTLLAAAVMFATRAGWPDIVVGAIIAAINLWAAVEVLWKARRELKT